MVDTVDHERFMKLALAQAVEAHDGGEFPVGCVIVQDDRVVAEGYRQNSFGTDCNELDHAEMIALRRLKRFRPDADLQTARLYSTMEPCLMCFSTLILSGVRTIVFGYEDVMGGGTGLPLQSLPPLYAEMKVQVVPGILRDECVELFKRFFTNPGSEYWKNSLLATYTLQQ